MYKIHYDRPNDKWMVFKVENGKQIYVCSFKTVTEAQKYVNAQKVVSLLEAV